MGEFGDKFRKARETKELSFDDVSNVIKISPRMLKAIEEQNFDQLPGGVFNKGFIRAYAKHLGLSPEDSIAEYLACVQQTQMAAQQAWQPEVPPSASPAAAAKTAAPARSQPPAKTSAPVQVEDLPHLQLPRASDIRPQRKAFAAGFAPEIPWRLVAAAVVVVILGILLWTRHSHSSRTDAAKSAAPAAVAASSPQTTTPASGNTQTSSAQSTTGAPAIPQPSSTSDVPADAVQDKSDVTVRTFGAPVTKAPAPVTGALTLVVRASENSWVSISADGQLLAAETLIAPAHPSFHASREFVVKVGNAAAVSFVLNGNEIAPQGNESEVKTLTFDSSGLRSAPGQTPPPSN